MSPYRLALVQRPTSALVPRASLWRRALAVLFRRLSGRLMDRRWRQLLRNGYQPAVGGCPMRALTRKDHK